MLKTSKKVKLFVLFVCFICTTINYSISIYGNKSTPEKETEGELPLP